MLGDKQAFHFALFKFGFCNRKRSKQEKKLKELCQTCGQKQWCDDHTVADSSPENTGAISNSQGLGSWEASSVRVKHLSSYIRRIQKARQSKKAAGFMARVGLGGGQQYTGHLSCRGRNFSCF